MKPSLLFNVSLSLFHLSLLSVGQSLDFKMEDEKCNKKVAFSCIDLFVGVDTGAAERQDTNIEIYIKR